MFRDDEQLSLVPLSAPPPALTAAGTLVWKVRGGRTRLWQEELPAKAGCYYRDSNGVPGPCRRGACVLQLNVATELGCCEGIPRIDAKRGKGIQREVSREGEGLTIMCKVFSKHAIKRGSK